MCSLARHILSAFSRSFLAVISGSFGKASKFSLLILLTRAVNSSIAVCVVGS